MGRKETFLSQKADDLIQIGLGQKLEALGGLFINGNDPGDQVMDPLVKLALGRVETFRKAQLAIQQRSN